MSNRNKPDLIEAGIRFLGLLPPPKLARAGDNLPSPLAYKPAPSQHQNEQPPRKRADHRQSAKPRLVRVSVMTCKHS